MAASFGAATQGASVPQRFLVFPHEATSPPLAQALSQFIESWNRVWATRIAKDLKLDPTQFETKVVLKSFKDQNWSSEFIGYFQSDVSTDSVFINQDLVDTWPRPWSREHRQKLSRVLAHEWQHRILHELQPSASWEIHEGLSTLWEHLYFQSIPQNITDAIHSPSFEFKWGAPNLAPTVQDYARAFLGVLWVYRKHSEKSEPQSREWLRRIYDTDKSAPRDELSMNQWLRELDVDGLDVDGLAVMSDDINKTLKRLQHLELTR